MWLYLEIGGFGLVATSCLILVTLWTVASRLLCPRGFLGKRTGMGCRFLLQGIFPTQELNPGLLHCRQILYRLSHKESPYLEIRAQEAQNHLPRSLIKYSIMSNKKNPLTILLQRITRIAVWLPVWFFSLCSGTWRHTQSSPWTSQIIYSVWVSRLFLRLDVIFLTVHISICKTTRIISNQLKSRKKTFWRIWRNSD